MLPLTWRSRWEAALLDAWTRRGFLACLMLPVALAVQIAGWLRRLFYELGVIHSGKVDATVIVVGNVVVGGGGKTPTVIALVDQLKARGIAVGVVSRGYGRGGQDTREVSSLSTARDVGDEPLLLHRKLQVPVFVGTSRLLAARALLLKNPQIEIIVCDDGMQHYALFRDLEVCVFDKRGCGNGWTVPSGPLRDLWPAPAVGRAGQSHQKRLVLHTDGPPAFAGHVARRELADHAVQQTGGLVSLASLASIDRPPLLALAGIAKPEAFFAMLRGKGLHLANTVALPDHYTFDSYSRSMHEGYKVICTEKDATKLWQTHPDALAIPLVQSMPRAFWDQFDALLTEAQQSRLSSKNGHPTT